MQTSTATGNFTGKMTDGGSAGEQLGIIVAYASSTPAISNISSSPGPLTAIITWTTSVTGDSLINFGTSTTYTNSSTYSSSYVTSHSVTLTGLTASTTYHYQIVSSDGLVATSSDQTFTTPSAGVLQSAASNSSYGGHRPLPRLGAMFTQMMWCGWPHMMKRSLAALPTLFRDAASRGHKKGLIPRMDTSHGMGRCPRPAVVW